MEDDVKPKRLQWAVFVVGALALSAIPFWLAFSHVLTGNALLAALFVWLLVYLAFTYTASSRLKSGRIGPVMRRYRRRLGVAMLSYGVVLIGSMSLLRGGSLAGPLLWIVAAAPAIPILGVIVVMGLYLKEEPDEFDRMIHVEAMLWGLGAVLGISTVWGFLANAEVVPAPPLFLIFPLFCLVWGISQPIIRRRYQ